MTASTTSEYKKGGSFLIEEHELDAIFIPEEFSEEDIEMATSIEKFIEGEVVPKIKQLALGNNEDMVALLKQAGELGLLGAEVPEEYGGMEIKKTTAGLISEKTGHDGGFAVSAGAHAGIGTMPITYFGNKEQKERYLPRLATGEILAAYALTETSSGSDAMNARTRATLSEDGKHYILNGSKMWITNAGFADVFVVFAKIDGEQFSAFIVEREYEGFDVGAEEKKMGIKSSSTRLITLDNVKVPVENLLGNPGDGSKIAFNILNIGRLKLGPGSLGTCKLALNAATNYALERRAFGRSISNFGLIQQKLADMAIRTFASESLSYRTAGYVDQILEDVHFGEEGAEEMILKGIREYAIECCLVKVFATEALDFVADEAVQVHGGYGYSAEYDVERYYRDSRINRIFEGTNEINRMLAVDMLLKKTMKGELPVMEKVQSLMGELMGAPTTPKEYSGVLAEQQRIVDNAKKIALFVSGVAVQKYMQKLSDEQELVAMGADILILTYALESMVLRTLKVAQEKGDEAASVMVEMTRVFAHDTIEKINTVGKTALAAMEEGESLQTMLKALRALVRHEPINTVQLRRGIAAATLEAKGYPF